MILFVWKYRLSGRLATVGSEGPIAAFLTIEAAENWLSDHTNRQSLYQLITSKDIENEDTLAPFCNGTEQSESD